MGKHKRNETVNFLSGRHTHFSTGIVNYVNFPWDSGKEKLYFESLKAYYIFYSTSWQVNSTFKSMWNNSDCSHSLWFDTYIKTFLLFFISFTIWTLYSVCIRQDISSNVIRGKKLKRFYGYEETIICFLSPIPEAIPKFLFET